METISKSELLQICQEILVQAGATVHDAAISAQILVLTDMRGVFSHGCVRLKNIVSSLQTGGFRSGVAAVIEHESAISAVVDGQAGLGLVVSSFAVDLAIAKAKQAGLGLVMVKNSHHNGASGIYSMQCADQGLIGMAMTNVPPLMAVTGSRGNGIGNNPFSYACPAGRYRAVMVDIAMSAVASGKLIMHAEEKIPIPHGWLLDRYGQDTDDPAEHFVAGSTLLPLGGHKGYALAVMVESLTGALTGAASIKENSPWNKDPQKPGNTGHFFLAFSPEFLHPGLDFARKMEEMIEYLHALPLGPGSERIYYPGEMEIESEKRAEEAGIILPPASLVSLREAALATGVSLPGSLGTAQAD